jgi:GTPase SAR1 family protein
MFAVDDVKSFENIPTIWIPEIIANSSTCSIILCGMKSDLRGRKDVEEKLHEKGQTFITREEGEFMAQHCGCAGYIEVSSLNNEGVQEAALYCTSRECDEKKSGCKSQ